MRKVSLLITAFVALVSGLSFASPAQAKSAADCDPNNFNTTFCAYYNSTWTAPYNAIFSVAGMPRNQCLQVSSGALEHSYTNETGAVIREYGSHLCDGALRGTANPFSSGAVSAGYTYIVRLAIN